MLYNLFVSLCLGMASKALLISIVVKSVLCAGPFELMPSKRCCVRLVVMCLWNVMVETHVVWVQGRHQGVLCSV